MLFTQVLTGVKASHQQGIRFREDHEKPSLYDRLRHPQFPNIVRGRLQRFQEPSAAPIPINQITNHPSLHGCGNKALTDQHVNR
jgi:hypothetical protein